jgi:hypothetical protein
MEECENGLEEFGIRDSVMQTHEEVFGTGRQKKSRNTPG